MAAKPSLTNPQLGRPENSAGFTSAPRHLEFVATSKLNTNPRNARTHSKKQIQQIAESIQRFGFNNPIMIDEAFGVIAGHGRLQAAKTLGLTEVPVMCLSHLSDAEKRTYILADNKIALNAGWDGELLALELGELADLLPEIHLDLEITGFETGEIDVLLADHDDLVPSQSDEDLLPSLQKVVTARPGDIWHLGDHRILCGDARDADANADLFAGQTASLVLTDPPYNVPVQGHVGGRGKIKHEEFPFASGEMSNEEFANFLSDSLKVM